MEMSARLPDSSDHRAWKRRIGDSGTKWREVRERKRKGGGRCGGSSSSSKRGGHRHGPALNNAHTHTVGSGKQSTKWKQLWRSRSSPPLQNLRRCHWTPWIASLQLSGRLQFQMLLESILLRKYTKLHKGLITLKAIIRPWLLIPNFPSNPFRVDG